MRSYIQLSSEGAQIVESKRTIRDKKGDSLLELPNSFTIIDIETTGLDPRFDEIIELSAISSDQRREVVKQSDTIQYLIYTETVCRLQATAYRFSFYEGKINCVHTISLFILRIN